MAADEFKETANTNWLSRLLTSLFGAVFGLLLLIGAFPLESWNECRAVDSIKALEEGAKNIISVDPETLDPKNNGKLIYLTGKAATDQTLKDPVFGIEKQAIRLYRNVEMYQWNEGSKTETRKKFGGGEEQQTVYTYDKQWSKSLISSDGFKKAAGHENPAQMPYKQAKYTVNDAHVGAYKLDEGSIDLFDLMFDDLAIDQPVGDVEGKPAKVVDKRLIFMGENPDKPNVGDTRVQYRYLGLGPVSIIAMQNKDGTLEAFKSHGRSIELAKSGTVPADDLFKQAKDESAGMTWLIRFGGFLMMWIGLALIGRPLSVMGDIVPFIGNLISAGIGFISFNLALVFSAVTISVAWIAVRPYLAVGIIVAVIVLVIMMQNSKSRAKPARQTA